MGSKNEKRADWIKRHHIADYVDAIIGPAPSALSEHGYKIRGGFRVEKIDANGFFYLHIQVYPPSKERMRHALRVFLQGSDGYTKHWRGFGEIYTGPVHVGTRGGKDYLQVKDWSLERSSISGFASPRDGVDVL